MGEKPHDAYSRVTNPGRFAPLHDAAEEVLENLKRDLEIDLQVGYGLVPELEDEGVARPSVRVSPRSPHAAPVTVIFSSFPGLKLRFGSFGSEAFPPCGCDACGGTAEGEITRFRELISNVAAGRLWESLELAHGRGRYRLRVWSEHGFSSRRGNVEYRDAVRTLAGGESKQVEWKPWPLRLGPDRQDR